MLAADKVVPDTSTTSPLAANLACKPSNEPAPVVPCQIATSKSFAINSKFF